MPAEHRQQGYVMLVMLMALFVGGSSLMLGALNNRQSITHQQQQELLHQMAKAREALLAYAAWSHMLFDNLYGPGFLPCPDKTQPDLPPAHPDFPKMGKPDVISGSPDDPAGICPPGNHLGRLPKHVLLPNGMLYNFSDYNSGIDQQFWYAVALEQHTRRPNAFLSRSRTDGNSFDRLSLDGQTGYVALIIAPGAALNNQVRTGNGKTNYTNYLEGNNGTSTTQYFTSDPANPDAFNDLIIGITHDELMQYVGASMTHQIHTLLTGYHSSHGTYPHSQVLQGTNFVHRDYLDELTIPNFWMNQDKEDWHSPTLSFTDILNHGFGIISYRRLQRTSYTINNQDTFTLSFFGCSSMSFQITSDGNLTRAGNRCQ